MQKKRKQACQEIKCITSLSKLNVVEQNTLSSFLTNRELFTYCLVNQYLYKRYKPLLYSRLVFASQSNVMCKKLTINKFKNDNIKNDITHLFFNDINFNKDILQLPLNLKVLTFHVKSKFNSALRLPISIQELYLPKNYMQLIENRNELINLTRLISNVNYVSQIPNLKSVTCWGNSTTYIDFQESITQLHCFNKMPFILPHSLTSLYFHPQSIIQKGMLPKTLIQLTMRCYDFKLKKHVLPLRLEELDIFFYKFPILKSNILPLTLKNLSLGKNFVDAPLYVNMTHLTTNMKNFSRETCPPNIIQLKVMYTKWTLTFDWPLSLTSLQTNCIEYSNIPIQLQHLYLIDRYGKEQNLQILTQLTNLKKLRLKGENSLTNFLLPFNVEELHLDVFEGKRNLLKTQNFNNTQKLKVLNLTYFNQCLSNIVFPQSLTHIGFGAEFCSTISSSKLPLNIETIQIHSKYLNMFKNLPFDLFVRYGNMCKLHFIH